MDPERDGFLNLLAASEADRAALEEEVCCVVLNDPASGVESAAALGFGAAAITARDDLRLVYLACEMGAGHGRGTVLRLAYRILRDQGYLVGDGHDWPRPGNWSADSLKNFAAHFCPEPAPAIQRGTLGLLIPRLKELCRREAEAVEHYRHAFKILTGRAA